MTLPSEGINPWRAAPAPGGPGAASANHTPARLPDLKLGRGDALEAPENPAEGVGGKEFKAFGDDGVTFWDLIDVVNPLQHIPVVSTLYRDLTGDTLDPAPRIMGGTLFLGPIGLVASAVNVMIEHDTGKDMGGHVLAFFRDDAAPLTAKTAETAPAAAGTDGGDPVTQWAAEQTAFYRGGRGTADPVSQWAVRQQAYYREAAPAAAGTDGVDVSAWAAEQTAYYRSGETDPAAADPVAAWARRQTAYYRAGAETGRADPATERTGHARTAQASRTGGGDDVSAWARDQLAWVMGDRAKELAALPDARPREPAGNPREAASDAPGAVAGGGGGFRDNLVAGWARYEAARRLAAPGHRSGPDPASHVR